MSLQIHARNPVGFARRAADVASSAGSLIVSIALFYGFVYGVSVVTAELSGATRGVHGEPLADWHKGYYIQPRVAGQAPVRK